MWGLPGRRGSVGCCPHEIAMDPEQLKALEELDAEVESAAGRGKKRVTSDE